MKMVARPLGQPGAHFRMFVGRIVVNHQMQVQFRRRLLVDQAQKCEKLLMAMASVAFADHLAVRHVQRGEQRGGAVADIVMGVAFGVSQSQRQHRLSAIQGLNLALLVDAQHHRIVGRIQIQCRDVSHLLNKEWIAGQLERLAQMRLDSEQVEPSLHGALRHLLGFRHQPNAPGTGIVRLFLQGPVDQLRHPLVIVGARTTGPQFVMQSANAKLQEPAPPLAHQRGGNVQPPRHVGIGQTFGAGQNDLCSLHRPCGMEVDCETDISCSRCSSSSVSGASGLPRGMITS